jgi:hypothetical protein
MQPRHLKVEELLRVDLRETLRAQRLREKARGHGRALTTVVPAAEGANENRPS